MRIIIRAKGTKNNFTNIKRDFTHCSAYSLDKENMVLELTHENTNYKVMYPLSCDEYITISPDEEEDV